MDNKGWKKVGLRGSAYYFQKVCMVMGLWCTGVVLAYGNQLTDLKFATLPGDQLELTLTFDSAPPVVHGYTTDQPARIALDFNGVTNVLPTKYFSVGKGNARSVAVVEGKNRTRVVVELAELSQYTSHVDGHQLIVVVGRGGAQEQSTAATKALSSAVVMKDKAVDSRSRVQNIDFRRGDQGAGLVVFKLSNPQATVDVNNEGGKITAKFFNATLAESAQRRLDVSDFATPVRTIDAMNQGSNSVVTIKPDGRYEYIAYQTKDIFTISVRSITEELANKRDKDKLIYRGEKLSLNFQSIEVRAVLQLIADFIGVNLVASDTVSGKVTLHLQEVPWDQALDLVLKTKGLDKRKVGNIMLVAPTAELAAQEKVELESNKQEQELLPLVTEFIPINYAKAKDLVALLSAKQGESGVLSTRGSVSVDDRTNTLLVTDTAPAIEQVRRIVAHLDLPVQQVLIEARIVIANADFNKELGVRWGGSKYHFNGNKLYSAGGSIETLGEQVDAIGDADKGEVIQDAVRATFADTLKVTSPNDLAVDLGVTGSGASSIAFGLTSLSSGLLQLELSALETSGNANIIATPKVLTADQQTAKISSGTQIPYQEASSSGATSVSFKDAVLSLEVKPQITPDGRVIMELKVNQDSVGALFNNIPSIDKNEINTRVLVENGETVVLGGVFRNSVVSSVVKTPFLGDLPIIGYLFRHTSKKDEKQELLIFITPNIVKNTLAQRS